MPSYGKFQSDNAKYTKKISRANTQNPDFCSQIKLNSNKLETAFERNSKKWRELIAYLRWYPDIFYDLITPETGGIRLDLDQRVLLRSMARFKSTYGTFARGYGKSMEIVMNKIHTAIFYPNSKLTMTAQTRENAAKILAEKYDELTRFYPLLKEEIYSVKMDKANARIEFHNGSFIDILANNQNSKGARRHQGTLDEDNLTNAETFMDALEPIFNIPRRTIGKKGVIDPFEGNGRIDFFTSAGYKGSSAYLRCLDHFKKMIELRGEICLGAGWKLAAKYGRGETVASILNKKARNTSISFAMNYEAHWTGCADNALVNINKLLLCRNYVNCELKGDGKTEYVLGVDVARSENTNDNNCQTLIAIGKVVKATNGRVKEIVLVNMISISGDMNFDAQAVEVKRQRNKYNASIIVVDENGLGRGLTDSLVKEQVDPITNELLCGYATINSDRISETANAEPIIYCYFAQSNDSEAIPMFMSMVETGRLRLLERRNDADFVITDDANINAEIRKPFIQTDFLIDEISNLKVVQLTNGKLSVERLVAKVPKDRYSATLYMLWYIMKYMDYIITQDDNSAEDTLSQFARIY